MSAHDYGEKPHFEFYQEDELPVGMQTYTVIPQKVGMTLCDKDPADLEDEWHFWNPGAMFEYTRMAFGMDPLSDWLYQNKEETLLHIYPFPLFDGLKKSCAIYDGNRYSWGNILCATRNNVWKSLKNHLLSSVSISDNANDCFFLYIGDVQIINPHWRLRSNMLATPPVPKISVSMICVNTMLHRWEVEYSTDPFGNPYFVKREPKPMPVITIDISDSIDVLDMSDSMKTMLRRLSGSDGADRYFPLN